MTLQEISKYVPFNKGQNKRDLPNLFNKVSLLDSIFGLTDFWVFVD